MKMLVEERGAALIIAMLVMVMLTLIGLAAINTSTTEMQISANVKGSSQALYLAEAGINQVSFWFNNSGTFAPPAGVADIPNITTPNNTTGSFFSKRRTRNGVASFIGATTNQSQFYDINDLGPVDTTNAATITTANKDITSWAMKITDSAYLDGMFGYLKDVGKITEIYVYGPILPGANGNYATVRVKAQTNLGATRTIEQEIGPSFFIPLAAGVESGAGGTLNGNTVGHWGSMRIQGDADINNSNLLPKTADDQWFNLTAGGSVTIGSGAGSTCTSGNPCANWPDSKVNAGQTVTIDKWDQAKVKSYAQGESSYYVYNCANNHIFKNSPGNVGDANDYGTFGTFANGNSFGLVYVDKGTNGAPCGATDKISIAGSFYTEGVFYMDIDFDMSGLGGGTIKTLTKPDGTTVNKGINFNGIVYTTGEVSVTGGANVYGSMVAEKGYGGSGGVDIWYNSALATGPILNIPVVSKQTWREIR